MSWRNRSLVGCAALILVSSCAALLLGASPDSASIATSPPQLVRTGEIDRYLVGGPERAALEFWHALQIDDAAEARSLAAAVSSGIGNGEWHKLVTEVGPVLGGLDVLGASIRGDRAAVRVYVVAYAGSPPKPAHLQSSTIFLRRYGGAWQVEDLAYFVQRAPGIRAASRGD